MLMRLLCLILLTLHVSGCGEEIPRPADPPKVPAICDGSRAARAELAAALAAIPDAAIVTPWGERILLSGAALVDIVDAGCAA